MTFQRKIFFSAIILAAGQSRRFGEQKILLPLGKSTVIENTVDNICKSKVNEVIVVSGYETDLLDELLKRRKTRIVFNKNYFVGIGSSIACGVKFISEESNAIVIFLADQPLISSSIINKLLDSYTISNNSILYPVYNNKKGHPVIFSVKYKIELMKLNGDRGAKKIIKKNPEDITEINVSTDEILKDIDTLEDYNSLSNIKKRTNYLGNV